MGFLLLGWLPILYFNRFLSVPDYFRKRFDDRTGVMATIIVLLYMIGYIGINLYTMGVAMNAMLGTDLFVSVVVVAVICAIYVTVGGQTSVIMTDLAQGAILLFAGLLLFVLGLGALGGWGEFWAGLPLLHRLPLAQFNEPHQFNFVGIFWQDGISNTFALYMMNQGFILRFLSLKSVNEAVAGGCGSERSVRGSGGEGLRARRIRVCDGGSDGRLDVHHRHTHQRRVGGGRE